MQIGYLHVGEREHGLYRYGALLAQAARQREDCSVVEVSLQIGRSWTQNRAALRQAARKLSDSTVVHLQYNKSIWGGKAGILYLDAFMRQCKAPVVVTLHDVYWQQVPFSIDKAPFYFKAMYGPWAIALRYILRQAASVFVCTQQEFSRLASIRSIQALVSQKVSIIPHFVEERVLSTERDRARKALALENFQVITLIGWIHPRKGHQLLIEALPNLPTTVKVIFAGKHSPGSEDFLQDLLRQAESAGVGSQLSVTGYLSEPMLEQYLVASDMAVCPFMSCSASGSLSTWISVAQPKILAYDLPQIQEYNRLEPGAIYTFSPYEPQAFSDAISQLLSVSAAQQPINNLKQNLKISHIVEQHLKRLNEIL